MKTSVDLMPYTTNILNDLLKQHSMFWIKRNTIIQAAIVAFSDMDYNRRKKFLDNIRRHDRRRYDCLQ